MKLVDPSRTPYQSYLLRVWWEGPQQGWHATLQSTATEQTYHFPTLEALLLFLSTPPHDGAATGSDRR